MANSNLMPLIVAVAIVGIVLPLKASSMPGLATRTSTNDGLQTSLYSGSYGQYDNRWLPLGEPSTSMLHRPLQRYALKHDVASALASAAEGGAAATDGGEARRSYRSHSFGSHGHGGLGAMLNGLTNLSGMGHISNGYASVAPTHTETLSKQEIPIYEEQHEDTDAVAAVAATANDYADAEAGRSIGYGSIAAGDEHIQQHQQQQQQQQQHQPYYNYPAEADYSSAYLPSFGGIDQSQHQHQPQHQHQQAGNHYAYDKISVGNYLHSGYEALQQHHANEQQHQEQQQQQQEQLEHASYFAPSHEERASDAEEHSSNFLAESNGHEDSHQQSQQSHSHHHHVDIINYVPVKHVKKQHVPVEKPVKIPISHAVIIPIKKPVPIHIPITKQVQVAIEKELKVPVERIVPYPVEKHIPVPVEKRVPYTVIKYLPVKVPKPFPVKVPVFKTVLHKVKSWW
ncbi:cAMP-dependent protein kinase catalytic subunit [Drosophila grimshawi]|uniref:cAMP-dependent protein kinase catalytic subunit n=1 Tax=Drosophila grimshawi TaxID=7222 RepID=UPI001C936A42|nr:cAMP-dependent protein kinase catalytic subunit [Drosophila grimshawi]